MITTWAQLRQYWAQNGIPDQSFDGLPQFNPTTGAAPLQGPAPSNPGCNPGDPAPSDCAFDPSHTVTSFHLNTVCTENTSPSWNEAHNDWDPDDNTGRNPAKNDGFVYTAAYDARALDYYDSDGIRAMGYYDGNELNYLYYMATNFATSDRFFNARHVAHQHQSRIPAGGNFRRIRLSQRNRRRRYAATPIQETIFEDLQNAGITWKIYVNPKALAARDRRTRPRA